MPKYLTNFEFDFEDIRLTWFDTETCGFKDEYVDPSDLASLLWEYSDLLMKANGDTLPGAMVSFWNAELS